MSRHILPMLIVMTLCILVSVGHAQLSTEGEVAAAGNAGLADFLAKIPPGTESLYGFGSQAEIGRAKLGTPFQVLTILPRTLREHLLPDKEYFVPTNEWRIPVTIDGEARALLTISQVGDNWCAVDFGAAGLAREIGTFCLAHGIDDARQGLAMVRLYQLKSDMLLVSEKNAPISSGKIFPLRSSEMLFERQKLATQPEYTQPKLLPLLKELYSREVFREE